MGRTRLLVLAAGALAAVVLLLLLPPGDEDGAEDGAAAPATTAAATTTKATPRRTGTTTRQRVPARPGVVTVAIRIRGGRPVGGIARPSVTQGLRVRLIVRSDVADHVHLHGYDLMRDVAPGSPAQLLFRASIPGRFEIELEDRGLQIAELEVRP